MLEKTSKLLTYQLYIKGEVEEAKIPVIEYGFEILISSLIILLSIMVYAGVVFKLSDGITFLLFFMPIRLFCGGYHAPTYNKCYIFTMLLFIAVIIISYMIPITRGCILIFCLTVCIVYIFRNAPCINVHHPLSKRRYKINKIRARIVIFLEASLSIILFYINNRLCTISVYTLLLVILMMYIPERRSRHVV